MEEANLRAGAGCGDTQSVALVFSNETLKCVSNTTSNSKRNEKWKGGREEQWKKGCFFC